MEEFKCPNCEAVIVYDSSENNEVTLVLEMIVRYSKPKEKVTKKVKKMLKCPKGHFNYFYVTKEYNK